MGQLNLRVLIEAVDRISRPMRGISRAVGPNLARSARAGGLAVKSLLGDLRRLATIGLAAAAAVSFGLYRMVRSTADAGDEAVKTSQKVGVGIEAWQRYAYAAQLSDVASDQLADGLKFLNQSVGLAAAGAGGDAKAFRALGINIRDQNGEVKSTGQLFEEVATRLTSMPDGYAKTTMAMTLMGRAGTELIPLLNTGGEEIRRLGDQAEQLGLIIPEDQARNAEAFNDAITTLQASLTGLGRGVSAGLLPQLTELIQKTTAWIGANKTAVIEKMKALLGQVSDALPGILKGLGDFAKLLGDIARAVAPVVRLLGGFGAVLDILAALMIGRVAVAIWMAVKAVWGLNAAMYANPVGLIIAGIAALVFAGWLLYRNWGKVVAGLKGIWSQFLRDCDTVWTKIKSGFATAMGALWKLLPPWLRMIFRGAAFTMRVVGQGLSGAGNDGQPPPPRPAPAGRSQLDAGGRMRIDLFDNRSPQLTARPNDPRMVYDWSTIRGGYGD